MPTIRPRFLPRLATFAFALTLCSLAAPDASAQFGGRLQAYSQRWYGQNFYDHQHNGYFSRGTCNRQNHMGVYGPPQMYSRQYGDEYGYAIARPFVPRPLGTNTGFEGSFTGP